MSITDRNENLELMKNNGNRGKEYDRMITMMGGNIATIAAG